MTPLDDREIWIDHISHTHEMLGVAEPHCESEMTIDVCKAAQSDTISMLANSSRYIEPVCELFSYLARFERGQPLRCYRTGPEFPSPALLVRASLGGDIVIEALVLPNLDGLLVGSLHERAIGRYPKKLVSRHLERLCCWITNYDAARQPRGGLFLN